MIADGGVIRVLTIISIILVISAGRSVRADITWHQTDTLAADGDTTSWQQTLRVTDDRFSIETGDGIRLVIDLAGDTMTTINTADETYMVMSLSALVKMRDAMKRQTRRLIDEAVRSMPEEQREEYRAELEKKLRLQSGVLLDDDASFPDPETFMPTGAEATMLGHGVVEYHAEAEDGTRHEVWCAPDIDTEELEHFMMNAGRTGLIDPATRQFSSLGLGFPLKSVTVTGDRRSESVVTSISRDPIDPAAFATPESYEKLPAGEGLEP